MDSPSAINSRIRNLLPKKTKIWKIWQRVFVHLAALVRRTHFIGTYFAEHVGVVGGGPPQILQGQKLSDQKPRLQCRSTRGG